MYFELSFSIKFKKKATSSNDLNLKIVFSQKVRKLPFLVRNEEIMSVLRQPMQNLN